MGFFEKFLGGQSSRDEQGDEIDRLAKEEIEKLAERGIRGEGSIEQKEIPPGMRPVSGKSRPARFNGIQRPALGDAV